MINVTCPKREANQDIVDIISEKNLGATKTMLQKISAKLIKRYSDYAEIELQRRLNSISIDPIEASALRNLYSSKTETAKLICKAALDIQPDAHGGCCISCGIGEADELDHFLPREHFPEFSILHKNLIPICGSCNKIKGKHIPGSDRDFLHPMYDAIPSEIFLTCTITYSNNIPRCEINMHPDEAGKRIEKHFTALKLKKRLQKKSTQYFLQIKALKKDLGDDYAKDEIVRDKQKCAVYFGANFWKCILCQEMIRTNFVDNV